MAYDPGAIDATLSAAVGDEPGLIAELRLAFHESAERALVTLERAPDQARWHDAARRLKGLAGSFGAIRLMRLAEEAASAEPHDPMIMRRLRRAVERVV